MPVTYWNSASATRWLNSIWKSALIAIFSAYNGTKRSRFVAILRKSEPGDQAKIIRGVLERIEPNTDQLSTRTKVLHDELLWRWPNDSKARAP